MPSQIRGAPRGKRVQLFRQADVTRAFRAAKEAGIDVRIDIAKGFLSIIPVHGPGLAETEADEIIAKLK
jgi:hypothetical protein